MCTELQSLGVKDILIACIDGLKAIPDAIRALFLEVKIQLCVIHMISNSIKYIPTKHVKEFMNDLKAIYGATTLDLAEHNLERLQQKWDASYPLAVKPWVFHWENLKTFFEFSNQIRRIIYTTNALESLHRQFRKVTKNKAVFPSDEALFKMLFLAARDISKKGTMPNRECETAISHLALAYGDRLGIANS
ncbi:transposase, mutator type (plasmid) [Candidatus Protochlamydia naegleriophila]|uniref:Mutator family transposase n=1 Tax=Candidatus Protochlamydia naegleriophila TaxID=389348 RepID=A0A0U5CSW5_9BACT|nr:transposase, mutator type [Candidatus Protochlamydia naegleriophila]